MNNINLFLFRNNLMVAPSWSNFFSHKTLFLIWFFQICIRKPVRISSNTLFLELEQKGAGNQTKLFRSGFMDQLFSKTWFLNQTTLEQTIHNFITIWFSEKSVRFKFSLERKKNAKLEKPLNKKHHYYQITLKLNGDICAVLNWWTISASQTSYYFVKDSIFMQE